MISRQSIGRVFFRSILVASFTQPFVFTEAVTFSFFKVADTDTVVPGSSATFEGFLGAEPVISGNNIAFLGQDNVNFNDGIYLFDGNILSVVADFSTPIPDRSGVNFTDFDEDLSISGSTVAFEGFVDNAGFTAFDNLVVTASGGNLTILAAETTTFVPPGNTSLFVDVDEPMIRGTTAVFVGNEDESDAGIFFSSGSAVSFIANLNAPVPGRPTYSFSQFDNNISFDGTRIGVESSITDGEDSGILLFTVTTGGVFESITDTIDSVIPGTTSTIFDSLSEPSIDNGIVAFGGNDTNGNQGIYTNLGGTLRVVADESTNVPGEDFTFTGFDPSDTSIEGNNIVFEGKFEINIGAGIGVEPQGFVSGEGLYIELNGNLMKIIDTGDTLDGKILTDIDIQFNGAISGDKVAFSASFSDGSKGIYFAVIPEPSISLLLASGVTFALLINALTRRRRGRSV